MAEAKRTYPMLPGSHWWDLRKKFRQSIPGVVTASYLATVLDMKPNSARANVLPFLKTLGIIDDEGKTTERAKAWRDDERYAAVCKDILEEVYPQELRDAITEKTQRTQAQNWFAHATGTGEAAAARMAGLYMLLLEADPTKQPEQEKEKIKKPARPAERHERIVPSPVTPPAPPPIPPPAPGAHSSSHTPHEPAVYINLEIHISADSTTDQIDAIFASMAKHIYKRG